MAHEAVSRRPGHWQQGLAVCLPRAAAVLPGAATVLTERGPDAGALRAQDRDAILFDLGLGHAHLRACVRAKEPETLAALRAGCGRPLLEPGNPAAIAIVHGSPHRVFASAVARIEVYAAIPPADGRTPEGPHTHLLPALLRTGRTHAATTHLPPGLVPVLEAFPPHPLADAAGSPIAFDPERHAAFQALLARHGTAAVLAEKRAVLAALDAAAGPEALPEPATREARAARRVALRQAARLLPAAPTLPAWRARWDRGRIAGPAPEGHG